MNQYEITILYAYHYAESHNEPNILHQNIPDDHIQLITVDEPDPYNPRTNSLAALAKAKGRFTIMLDEDDEFEATLLPVLLKAASEPDIAFSMPGHWFKCYQSPSQHFNPKEPEDIRMDTRERQFIFPAELHGLMIPTADLKKAAQDLDYPIEPEKQIILRLLAEKPVLNFIGTQILTFAFPKENNAEYDLRNHSKPWYTEPFEKFVLPYFKNQKEKNGSISPLAQTLALYMINIRIAGNSNNRNKHVLAREDVFPFVDLLSNVFEYIDTKTIFNGREDCQLTHLSSQRILFYMQVKNRDFSYYPDLRCLKDNIELICDDQLLGTLSEIPMRIQQLDYSDGHLEIDGGYYDLLPQKNTEVLAKFGKDYFKLNYNQRYSMTKYFGVTAFRMKTFHVSIPVAKSDKDRKLNFVFRTQGKEYVMEYNFPSQGSRFAKDFGYAYWRFGDYISFWQKDGIHVAPSTKLKVLKKEVALWLQMWKKKEGFYRYQIPLKIINFVLRPYFNKQKIWLFMDKIYKGADSSEYIYRYAVKQNDGIKKYYLLDKTSADYKRMRKEGYHPLVRRSLKHRLVFLNADMIIASNSTVWAFNDYPFTRSLPMRGDVHFDVACVQHGMSIQKIAIAQQRLRDNTRLYFCASKYEIENLSKKEYDYIGYDALKLTGVPRYDGLVDRSQKILVISPTWRMQSALPVKFSESFARDYNPNFKETEYYKVYNSLINDPRLLDAARKYGYRIQYVLHPIVSPQHEDFDTNDLVEIIPSIGDMSYEKIFCEGSLMVTDYSGVQFDFAYMRKPVVYLHHNDIPQHYEEGTFHYTTMGFGEICHTNDELIDTLCSYMQNNCVMPEMYRKRADDFFEFSDNHNCERIYPIMLEHTRNRR